MQVAEDHLYELVIEAGAEDIEREGRTASSITCPVSGLRGREDRRSRRRGSSLAAPSSLMMPTSTVDVDEDTARKVMRIQIAPRGQRRRPDR